MGEGIVEFAKKSSASACLRLCNEKCFFLTASLRPCLVEPMEVNDDNDGLPEKAFNKKMPDFNHERGVGPRFADLNSFEHEYGSRWKQLHNLFKTKQDALKRELKMEEDKLEAQMEYARYEQETELLRQGEYVTIKSDFRLRKAISTFSLFFDLNLILTSNKRATKRNVQTKLCKKFVLFVGFLIEVCKY